MSRWFAMTSSFIVYYGQTLWKNLADDFELKESTVGVEEE